MALSKAIEKLEWDSTHFKLSVGKFELSNDSDFELLSSLSKDAFDVIYLFTTPELSQQFNSWFLFHQLNLMDRKQLLAMAVPNGRSIEIDSSISEVTILSERALSLAFQSAAYSRFKIDSNFEKEVWQTLYTNWIEGSVSKRIAKATYGYFEAGNLLGLITYGIKNGAGDIGLLAVDEATRGKGIGKKLVAKVINQSISDTLEKLTVVTQGLNVNAVNFYKTCGFEVENEIDIYHYWVKR